MRHRGVSIIGRQPQRLADDGVEIARESRAGAPVVARGAVSMAGTRGSSPRPKRLEHFDQRRPHAGAARYGKAPLSNSYSTTPSEYTSVSVEIVAPRNLLRRCIQRRQRHRPACA